MSTTSNKRIKTQHHSSTSTSSNETILRHLVLDGTTERTSTTIEEGEYSESETLETVRILQSSNISCIGDKAFYRCRSLQSIEIDAGTVTAIGGRAFHECTSLKSIYIDANTVTTVGESAFCFCTSLASIGERSHHIVSVPCSKSWLLVPPLPGTTQGLALKPRLTSTIPSLDAQHPPHTHPSQAERGWGL